VAKKRKKFLIPNSIIRDEEFNDLFREWRRERYSSICVVRSLVRLFREYSMFQENN